MKVLEFETISPFYEEGRDGIKPFILLKRDYKDSRVRALAQWKPEYEWKVRITNPATGESFTRLLHCVSFFGYYDFTEESYPARQKTFWDWLIIVLEEEK